MSFLSLQSDQICYFNLWFNFLRGLSLYPLGGHRSIGGGGNTRVERVMTYIYWPKCRQKVIPFGCITHGWHDSFYGSLSRTSPTQRYSPPRFERFLPGVDPLTGLEGGLESFVLILKVLFCTLLGPGSLDDYFPQTLRLTVKVVKGWCTESHSLQKIRDLRSVSDFRILTPRPQSFGSNFQSGQWLIDCLDPVQSDIFICVVKYK